MSYEIVLSLTRSWLSAADDPLDSIVFGTARSSDWTLARNGTVRQFGSGRRQGSRGRAILRTLPMQFVGLSSADVLWLENHLGDVMLFRSKIGERYFGSFYQLGGRGIDHASLHDGVYHNVSVEFYELDYDESFTP